MAARAAAKALLSHKRDPFEAYRLEIADPGAHQRKYVRVRKNPASPSEKHSVRILLGSFARPAWKDGLTLPSSAFCSSARRSIAIRSMLFEKANSIDYLINETYHGIIAAIVTGKPFVSIDVEPEATSRKQQLLESGLVESISNGMSASLGDKNVSKLSRAIARLLSGVLPIASDLCVVRSQICSHLNRMAQIIETCHEVDHLPETGAAEVVPGAESQHPDSRR